MRIGYIRRNASDLRDHPNTEQLSLCHEGLLDEADSVSIRDHLGSCLTCARVDDQLADQTSRLAAALVPPMPSQFTARIDQALAAEAVRREAGRAACLTLGNGTRL